MIQPNQQKAGEISSEEVLFNSDTLSKIISYLPSIDVLSLVLTNKRFGVSNTNDNSIIDESTRIAIHEMATEEQLAALPRYDGESSLADYHYLQLLREPLTFDQLVGADYVNSLDKSSVVPSNMEAAHGWRTAFSNNILMAGKHFASFEVSSSSFPFIMLGVMRPGQANQCPHFQAPVFDFYQNFSWKREDCNSIQCCMYDASNGNCYTSDWERNSPTVETWDGMESSMPEIGILLDLGDWEGMDAMRFDGEIGMLLDLDEGTLTVFQNGRKLGVMKRGLAGPYCWVTTMIEGHQVTIKRGVIPPS